MAGICNSLKYDALTMAVSSSDTVKVAFYSAAASIDATTAAYSATNEVTHGAIIPAGGVTLTSLSASAGATSSLDWANPQLTPTGSVTFQKLLVYNDTRSDRALWFHDYGTVQTWNSGTQYTLNIPGDGGTGLIRLS